MIYVYMCIDLRKVNQAILRERYPIPTMQEMLAELNGAKVFSKLDLKQGFFSARIRNRVERYNNVYNSCRPFSHEKVKYGSFLCSSNFSVYNSEGFDRFAWGIKHGR